MTDFEIEIVCKLKCLLELKKDIENYDGKYWEVIIDGKIDGLKNMLNAIRSKYDNDKEAS